MNKRPVYKDESLGIAWTTTSQGNEITVDLSNGELLEKHSWSDSGTPSSTYPATRIDNKKFLLHQLITSFDLTDHANGNRYDNRLENLREANKSQNGANSKVSSRNSSGYKGVSWRKDKSKFSARIKVDYNTIFLGYFDDSYEAALAYDTAALKYFGEFASTNETLGLYEWSSDNYETPERISQYLANLVEGSLKPLEFSAGTGQIAKYLIRGTAIELRKERLLIGSNRYPSIEWVYGSFLDYNEKHDAILGNPPFSLIPEFLCHIPNVLLSGGLCHILMPSDSFQSIKRSEALKRSGLEIIREHKIVGRVAYLRNGIPLKGRQVYDSIFTMGRIEDKHPSQKTAFLTKPNENL